MIVKKALNTANVILILVVTSIFGKPTCRTVFRLFRAETLCKGNDDYILRRGLVSDNNNTEAITLKHCQITEVEFEAFKNNYNLEDLNLSLNKISYLKPGVFDGIPKLRTLRLAKNSLTIIPLGLFDQLPKLRNLDISDNNINSIALGVFDSLVDLILLDVSGNAFLGKYLDPCLFNRNSKIISLELSRNNMSEAPDNLLSAMQQLHNLWLNNCSLSEVPKFATSSNLKTLKQLRLQTNIIKSLDDPEIFANLENLESLDLIGNSIDKLNGNVFKPLSKLTSIDLSFNNIEQIPENLFRNMYSIEDVDLRYNFIEVVPITAFRGTRLETLDLRNNRISFLDRDFCFEITYHHNRLKIFNFNDNPFQCACLLEILNEVKKFGIEYNSDKYNGEEAVCLMTYGYTCVRDNFDYPIDVRQLSSSKKGQTYQRHGNISNGYQTPYFGHAYHMISIND